MPATPPKRRSVKSGLGQDAAGAADGHERAKDYLSPAEVAKRDGLDLDCARLWVCRLKGGLSVEQPISGDELRAIKRHLATRTDALS